MRFDSMGLYAAVPVLDFTRCITPARLTGDTVACAKKEPEFDCFEQSQGYDDA